MMDLFGGLSGFGREMLRNQISRGVKNEIVRHTVRDVTGSIIRSNASSGVLSLVKPSMDSFKRNMAMNLITAAAKKKLSEKTKDKLIDTAIDVGAYAAVSAVAGYQNVKAQDYRTQKEIEVMTEKNKLDKDYASHINSLQKEAGTTGASGEMAPVPLQEAALTSPRGMGVYRIYMDKTVVYVGKASDGIRKRMVQYVNGTTTDYPSGCRIYENQDELKVLWQELESATECERKEAEWIEYFNPEWNERKGWKQKE